MKLFPLCLIFLSLSTLGAYPEAFIETDSSIVETYQYSRSKDWGSRVNGKNTRKADGILDYEVAFHTLKLKFDFSQCDESHKGKVKLWFDTLLSRGGMSAAITNFGIYNFRDKNFSSFKIREDKDAKASEESFKRQHKIGSNVRIIGSSWDTQVQLAEVSCDAGENRGFFTVLSKSQIESNPERQWQLGTYLFEWNIEVHENIKHSNVAIKAYVHDNLKGAGKFLMPGQFRGPRMPKVRMGDGYDEKSGFPAINIKDFDFEEYGIFNAADLSLDEIR